MHAMNYAPGRTVQLTLDAYLVLTDAIGFTRQNHERPPQSEDVLLVMTQYRGTTAGLMLDQFGITPEVVASEMAYAALDLSIEESPEMAAYRQNIGNFESLGNVLDAAMREVSGPRSTEQLHEVDTHHLLLGIASDTSSSLGGMILQKMGASAGRLRTLMHEMMLVA